MARSAPAPGTARFSVFEADRSAGRLLKGGKPVKLAPQPFKVLLLLLDRHGQVVTREEIRGHLWGESTFVDFERGINFSINQIRAALGDDAERPRYVETLPKLGYRFLAEVTDGAEPAPTVHPARAVELESDLSDGSADETHPLVAPALTLPVRNELQQPWRSPVVWAGAAVVVLLCAVAVTVQMSRAQAIPLGISGRFERAAVPHVVATVRLTNDGARKYSLVTDGVRLYFSERGTIFQASVDGGETTKIATHLTDLDLYDISQHGSELLVSAGVRGSPTVELPVWAISLPSGSPHRLGEIKALGASWSRDGQHLAYAANDGLYLANNNGTGVRKLTGLAGTPGKLQFSPDGGRIRFDAYDNRRHLASIWEVGTNGRGMRLLFPEIQQPLHTGAWSEDGKYFFFNSHEPEKDLDDHVWVSLESSGPTRSRDSAPRLTTGPMVFGNAVPSPDGKHIYAIGTESRAELVRYDSHSNQFLPYLSGISASLADVSRDGQWITYVSYPDLTLWRCKLDGTQRLQLTSPPMQVATPQWSPDGTRLIFTDVEPGKTWKIDVIPAAGGKAEELLPGDAVAEIDPSWSADGKSIVFGRPVTEPDRRIQTIDLTTHAISTLPESEGLFSPRLSPDGRYVAAFPADASKLMLYDFRTERWAGHGHGHGPFQFDIWSRDGKKIYLLQEANDNEIVRFDVARQQFEHVVSLRHLEQGNREWIGLAEDGSPLVALDKSVCDVFRLDLAYR